jgi:glycosyltransferase involved in cell wall biosynthesis
VIFFDNYSSDGTGDLVGQYKDERVKYFRSEEFLSLGEARNEAIRLSNGDFLAFLDADDIWYPRKLELQMKCFTDGVGLVHTRTEIVNEGSVTKRVGNRSPEGYVFGHLLSAYFLVMSSVVISREALNSLSHFFDPRFEIIEEYDLFLRIAANWKVSCVRSYLTQWRWHSASTTMVKTKLISQEKRAMLRKLKCEYPDLYKINHSRVNIVKGKIMVTTALDLYRSGQPAKARRLLRKSNVITGKGLFVYIASYFPGPLVDRVYRRVKGNPLI